MVALYSTLLPILLVLPGALSTPLPLGAPQPPIFDPSDPRPLVESNKLRRALTRSALLHHAAHWERMAIGSADGNRGFGGIGHNASVGYLYNEVSKLSEHFDVAFQPFQERYSAATGSFLVDGEEQKFYAARGSPSTTGLKAQLGAAKGEGCNDKDFAGELTGKIVLMMRGNCTITLKSQLAKKFGAVGAVVYNSVTGTILDGRVLDVPDLVPTGAMGKEAGLALVKRIESGETLLGEINVKSFSQVRTTFNVIAETKGGDKNNVIMLGAHSDSVPLGPGINDNGSGSLGLLELLKCLKEFKTNSAIRFGWFSAEEFGLLGAAHYVKSLSAEEQSKIAMYINADMIASPNYIYGVYDGSGRAFNLTGPAGSAEIQHTLESFFAQSGLASVPTAFTGRSDYGPFLEVGIPSGGLFTGAEGIKTTYEQELFGGAAGQPYDINYHQPGDGVKNVNVGAWVNNVKALADVIGVYGRSLEGFPREKRKAGKRDFEWTIGSHGHGHNHGAEAGEGGCGDGLY